MTMNATPQQILDIEDALVSGDNPAHDDGTLDYERCARLHNYLVAYGWMARNGRDTPDLDALASEKWFFHEANEEVEAIRERLDVPLNKFLDLIYDPRPPFFYWIDGLVMELSDEYFIDDNEMEENKERFVLIYRTIADLGGHNLGVVYDQQLNRASFPMTTDNMESVEPIDEHEEMWFPLETILTQWIYMTQIGKAVPGLPEELPSGDPPTNRSQFYLWSWLPYCDAQIDSTVAAIERYSAAVESRVPPDSLLPISAPLFTSAELDAAAVPQDCFIRSLLTRVKTPRFKFIAPGLEVPHDKEAFARRQRFTHIPHEEDSIPGVLLFASPDRLVDLNLEIRRLFSTAHDNVSMNDNDPVPTGLYSEPVRRRDYDMEEAGFRLVLPFALRPGFFRDEDGARMSDGRPVPSGSFTELFQHGCFHPFGGERRSQRLERLFERWIVLVESGVWTVGEDGVEGGIDKFGDADRGAWNEYSIAPSW
ncbi:hypothetical protein PENARI_c008G01235 [Penicillium arizonense]|uniref:Uncharacterized protein n=1 Tax=Penicillium arizonense TaxID=1835702 RepID=A0A1F5LJK4_PENAI|nr:hypothetical protein PENARI_c008G01235 [Penicillium arizonense]OGE53200.1 hypothetical protein PENARI_c008G01235 [Penicillium arizonense]